MATTSEKTSEKPREVSQRSRTRPSIKGDGKAAAAPPARDRDPVRDKAIDLAVSTIEKQFGKGSIMRLGEGMAPPEVPGDPDRLAGARHRARRRRAAARARHRGLRAGVLGQDDAGAARGRRGAEAGRHLRLHRRGARARRRLRAQAGRADRRPAGLAARLRRAGAGDHRDAGRARARSTSWSSTRWRRWCRGPSSRARWATRTSACRRGS